MGLELHLGPARMTALATTTTTRPQVGKRTELGRYTLADGTVRLVIGQRINGSVRFLPDQPVVLELPSSDSEDSGCRPRESDEKEARANAGRPKRPNGDGEPTASADVNTSPRGRTGARVELARYTVSGDERVLYGQRVCGVVRVTDVPSVPGGRAYLVERRLEEEGANANAALQALIADYLGRAAVLDDVPMATILLD